jgi:hypothetical protein
MALFQAHLDVLIAAFDEANFIELGPAALVVHRQFPDKPKQQTMAALQAASADLAAQRVPTHKPTSRSDGGCRGTSKTPEVSMRSRAPTTGNSVNWSRLGESNPRPTHYE